MVGAMRQPPVVFFLTLAVFLLVACASRTPVTSSEIEKRRWHALDNQVDSQAQEIQRLTDTIASLEKRLANDPKPSAGSARALPLTKLEPDAPDEEDLAVDGMLETEELPPADPAPMREANVVADSRHEAIGQYYRGIHWYENKNYDAAVREFTAFLRDNPDHVYADRAQYWLTECHFENHDYGLVIYASNQLEAKFPYSLRVPEAMQKRALAYMEMGQLDDAAMTLRDLLKRYPDASVADAASHLLATVTVPRESAKALDAEKDPREGSAAFDAEKDGHP
jgi:TolA-binding protein